MENIKLLEKYMAHVIDCEGIDFVNQIPYKQQFTDEEITKLRNIANSIF